MYRKASILLNLCAINKLKPLHRHTTIKCVFVHNYVVCSINVPYIACTPVVYVICRR